MVVGRESSRQYADNTEIVPHVCLRAVRDWRRKHFLSFDVPEGYGDKTELEKTLPDSGCWNEFKAYGQVVYRFNRPLTPFEVQRIDEKLSRLYIPSWEYGEYGEAV